MITTHTEALAELVASLRARRELRIDEVELALVLGSGLGAFADCLEEPVAVGYDELPGMPTSSVPGHAGRLVAGTLAGRRVLVQQGRVHLYEGWSAHEVTRAVRAFAACGVRGLLLTNAAGGANRDFEPGTLMRLRDQLNWQGVSPLFAGESDPAADGSVHDPELGAVLDRVAAETGNPLEVGVYVGNLGPAYETPAEVEMARRFGGDAVGMSTVLEASAARAAGMRVVAISCITNLAAGISPVPLSHEEVMETGAAVAARFQRLLTDAVPELCACLDRT
jgi:purine-nucleoside phosphorylase